ncbi:MAG: ParB/RepB/Spo0J family partition protein [Candidatus Omnitrophota bacterium]|nr:ParB/RepB/Spo0J family partition protein [Candidatus Omnitrophota bacterium]
MEKRALGKGLKALIPDDVAIKPGERGTVQIKTDEISPGRFQPREMFDPDKLKELILSVKEKGVLQPVIVRPKGNGYELIAGERRLRAAKELGFSQVPAIIMDVKDGEALEIALVENLQRDDLNPMEEAKAYQRLADEFSLTQEDISAKVGRDRASISNTLRLLKLPEKIKEEIYQGRISMGHAKAILMLESERAQLELCNKIIKRGLSVREAEYFVKRKMTGSSYGRPRKHSTEIRAVEEELQRILGTRVTLLHQSKRGKIIVEYYSNDDLERLLNLFRGRARSK